CSRRAARRGARLAGRAARMTASPSVAAGAPPRGPGPMRGPATPDTVVRRALWLDSTYDLAGSVLLFLGDHDLTSLAVGQVGPAAGLVVVDIDEATLEVIDPQADRLGIGVRGLAGGLPLRLPDHGG